jgi:hypothetical protein
VGLDYLRKIGQGVLHIPESDYLIMNPVKIIIAYKGYLEHEEQSEKNHSYRARQIAYTVYCSIPLKNAHIPIGQFWPIDEGEGRMEVEDRKELYFKNRKWLKPRKVS